MWFDCSSRLRRRGNASRRGNVFIEFAIAFSLIWSCLTAVFQFGYAMSIYNALIIAVSNGARYAATVDFSPTSSSFVTAIQNAVVFGDPNGGTTPLVPGLDVSKVAVTWTSDGTGVPQTITVAIQNYSCNVVFRAFTWTNKPSTTVRFTGVLKS